MITPAWHLIRIQGEQVILCLLCSRYSANENDIAARWCSACQQYLDEIPRDYEPVPVIQDYPRLRRPTLTAALPPPWTEVIWSKLFNTDLPKPNVVK